MLFRRTDNVAVSIESRIQAKRKMRAYNRLDQKPRGRCRASSIQGIFFAIKQQQKDWERSKLPRPAWPTSPSGAGMSSPHPPRQLHPPVLHC